MKNFNVGDLVRVNNKFATNFTNRIGLIKKILHNKVERSPMFYNVEIFIDNKIVNFYFEELELMA